MRWTEEEEKLLKQMCAGGIILDDMEMVFLQHNREQIRQKCCRMGFKIQYLKKANIDMDAFNKLMKGK